MSGRYPGHRPHPFSASELGGLDLPPDELAAAGVLARELEAVADRGTVRPSGDFTDRVMAAIAAEPAPAPVLAAGSAVRRLSLAALLASIRDAARVALGTGFPLAARAQGIALVLVAALVVDDSRGGDGGRLRAARRPPARPGAQHAGRTGHRDRPPPRRRRRPPLRRASRARPRRPRRQSPARIPPASPWTAPSPPRPPTTAGRMGRADRADREGPACRVRLSPASRRVRPPGPTGPRRPGPRPRTAAASTMRRSRRDPRPLPRPLPRPTERRSPRPRQGTD